MAPTAPTSAPLITGWGEKCYKVSFQVKTSFFFRFCVYSGFFILFFNFIHFFLGFLVAFMNKFLYFLNLAVAIAVLVCVCACALFGLR